VVIHGLLLLSFGLMSGLFFAAVAFYKGKERGRNDEAAEYSVITVPVYHEFSRFMKIGSKKKVQVGYFYQTFVKGMPAIKSEEIFVKTIETSEVDEEKIARLVGEVVRSSLPTFVRLAEKMRSFNFQSAQKIQNEIRE
jgi:hypothetical protein